jgi:hypothetical protein
MARIWRDGQKKKTFIYRLIAKDVIDEAIIMRQRSKSALAAVMEGNEQNESPSSVDKINSKRLSLTASDIINLIQPKFPTSTFSSKQADIDKENQTQRVNQQTSSPMRKKRKFIIDSDSDEEDKGGAHEQETNTCIINGDDNDVEAVQVAGDIVPANEDLADDAIVNLLDELRHQRVSYCLILSCCDHIYH